MQSSVSVPTGLRSWRTFPKRREALSRRGYIGRPGVDGEGICVAPPRLRTFQALGAKAGARVTELSVQVPQPGEGLVVWAAIEFAATNW